MRHFKADIVVLSAGTAGLPAAVTAAEGGASVIVLEKTGRTGGTANRGNDILAIESRFQKAYPPVMTKEEAFKTHMEWTHWRVDAQLVTAVINKSGSTIDWLEDLGVEFSPPYGGPDGRPATTLRIKGEPPGPKQIGQAAAMAKILTRRAKDLGVQFFLKTPAKKILKKGERIVGVMAENEAGEEIRVEAKAVIIATGGFAANKELVKKYTGYDEGQNMVALQKAGIMGDGIRMAWEVGAAASPMMIGLTHNLPPPCHGGGGTSMEFSAFTQPENIMVNFSGERFLNDDLRGSHGSAGAHGTVASIIALQKGKVGFMIFDGALKKYYKTKPSPFPRGDMQQYQTFKHDDLDDNIREVQSRGYKYIFMADSLEDLCSQTGINYEGLKKTLAEYNKACAMGQDELFHKLPEYLKPIKGPKFYAGKFIAGAYGTSGGIKTNFKMEVLTKDFEVIPGLYAAGNDANNMYDHSYTPLAGNYIGFAVNSGRMAAESALEYTKGEQ